MRILPALLLAISSTAFAITIPCTNPGSHGATCSNANFAFVAQQLSAAYQQAGQELSQRAVSRMNADKEAWLLWSNTICSPKQTTTKHAACLLLLYREQTKMLTGGTTIIDGTQFYPRVKVMIVPEPNGPHPEIHDPGYGAGRFTWPQIDHPTHAQAAWNCAIAKEASRLVSQHRKDASQDLFNPAPLLNKQVLTYYRLEAANHRLISVTFTRLVSPYGAAHPNNTIRHMNWWLPRRRALRAADVFRNGSGWKPFLAKASYRQLIAQAKCNHTFPYLLPEKESLPAARKAVVNLTNWIISRDGLTIAFPQYSVAAGAFGSPEVRLPWRMLRPYLNPHLHPATLPKLRARPKS